MSGMEKLRERTLARERYCREALERYGLQPKLSGEQGDTEAGGAGVTSENVPAEKQLQEEVQEAGLYKCLLQDKIREIN